MKKTSYLLFVVCFLFLGNYALLLGQGSKSVVEQTIKDWFYPHYQNNVLVWEARGKTAIIRKNPSLEPNQEATQTISIESLELIFHHRPEGASFGQPEELIFVKADKGTIYQPARIADLEGNIVIETPGKTTLLAQELSVELNRGEISSRKEVMVIRSNFSLKGHGIKGDLTLKKITFRHGKKEAVLTEGIVSDTNTVSSTNNSSSSNGYIYITCEGLLTYNLEAQEMLFNDHVYIIQKVSHSVPTIQSILKAQTLDISFDSQTNRFQKLRAQGGILLITAEGNKAAGDIFTWQPNVHLINIKSSFVTKVWHKNNLIEAAEIRIVTSADTFGQLGAWEKVKAINRNGSVGTIKITTPEDK